jgi:Glycerate kinase family
VPSQSKRRARPPVGISETVLVAAEAFNARLDAGAVAAALVDGLLEDGRLQTDVYELGVPGALGEDFDARMKAARAVVIVTPRLDEQTLLGSLPFEIATRARQAGVPAYAVTRENDLDLFDARILDLQVVAQARSAQTLTRAGERLAEAI